ncbi:hypothetical protein [Actinoplanes awajinensis]|uniref:hypothetical protein n=1 Tax=Actinoplanes awajinensis TaxID=135946 RepID=UPI0012F8D3B8|nr:hypothetical protein [Actinoplanes awajinensis]
MAMLATISTAIRSADGIFGTVDRHGMMAAMAHDVARHGEIDSVRAGRLQNLADGYYERATRSLGVRLVDGQMVKLYAIEAPERRVGAAQQQSALDLFAQIRYRPRQPPPEPCAVSPHPSPTLRPNRELGGRSPRGGYPRGMDGRFRPK